MHPPRIEITSGCEVLHVGAGNQTEGHYKSTVPSKQTLSHLSMLSHLSSPTLDVLPSITYMSRTPMQLNTEPII